jgi:hypothetical protein
VGDKGFEQAGYSFVSEPVAYDDVADAEGLGKVVGAGVWEGLGVLGVFEVDVALGVPVVFGEGGAVAEVGVTV